MSSSPSSASWSNRSSAPTIALKKVTLRVTTKYGVKTKRNKTNVRRKKGKSFNKKKTHETRLLQIGEKLLVLKDFTILINV